MKAVIFGRGTIDNLFAIHAITERQEKKVGKVIRKENLGLFGKIINVASKLPIATVSKPAKVIQEATQINQATTKKSKIDLIELANYPMVQAVIDVNNDGVVDYKDIQALISKKGKELTAKIVAIVIAIIIGGISMYFQL
jgi:hypothetical protein